MTTHQVRNANESCVHRTPRRAGSLKFGEMPIPWRTRRGRGRYRRRQRQWRGLEGEGWQIGPAFEIPYILGRDFSASCRPLGKALLTSALATRFLASAMSARRRLCEKIAIKAAIVARENRPAVACRCRSIGARRLNGRLHGRGHAETEGRRDHPDPGRRRRCREFFAIQLAKHLGAA